MAEPTTTPATRYENTPEAKKLRETQQNVQEVVDIMHDNVKLVEERNGKLTEMDERSKNLEESCKQFQNTTVKLRRKMWYQNVRMKIIIGIIVLLLVLLLVYSLFL